MKLIGPGFSLGASGKFGNAMVFASRKGTAYARQLVIPTYRRTTEQAAVRDVLKDASLAWKNNSTIGGVVIDQEYKDAFNDAVLGTKKSGFNQFIIEVMAGNLVDTAGVKSYDGSLAIPATPGATI
jgi:hypothetical protein